jgi:peptide/nickel transport system permease protein
MWWKFRRHRVAVWSGVFLALIYGSILISEFLAPYNLHTRNIEFIYTPRRRHPPVPRGRVRRAVRLRPDFELNMTNLQREYAEDRSVIHPIRFFCRGDSYEFWGLFRRTCTCSARPDGGNLFLLGTDRLGRDVLSRIIYGARISLTVGLIGIAISFSLGISIGGWRAISAAWVDLIVQRIIEVCSRCRRCRCGWRWPPSCR